MAEIGDAAVKRATGKTWAQWFALLDRDGAGNKDHKGIVSCVGRRRPSLGGWWQQTVAVAYEQASGLRKPHETPRGFQVSGSKVVGVPLGELYRAWSDVRARRRWLDDPVFTVRKSTAKKSMRITWADGETSVEANFYAKGAGKSQVAVQHNKLKSAAAAVRTKRYWATQLARLKAVLEG